MEEESSYSGMDDTTLRELLCSNGIDVSFVFIFIPYFLLLTLNNLGKPRT